MTVQTVVQKSSEVLTYNANRNVTKSFNMLYKCYLFVIIILLCNHILTNREI